jgi:hypothetical protein
MKLSRLMALTGAFIALAIVVPAAALAHTVVNHPAARCATPNLFECDVTLTNQDSPKYLMAIGAGNAVILWTSRSNRSEHWDIYYVKGTTNQVVIYKHGTSRAVTYPGLGCTSDGHRWRSCLWVKRYSGHTDQKFFFKNRNGFLSFKAEKADSGIDNPFGDGKKGNQVIMYDPYRATDHAMHWSSTSG